MDRIELLAPKTTPVDAIAQDVYEIIDRVPDAEERPNIRYCRQLVEECITNKSKLIALLSKHPNWDADNYRIHFNADFERAVDTDTARSQLDLLLSVLQRYFFKQLNAVRSKYGFVRDNYALNLRMFQNRSRYYYNKDGYEVFRPHNPLAPRREFYAPVPLIGLSKQDMFTFLYHDNAEIIERDEDKSLRDRVIDFPDLAKLILTIYNSFCLDGFTNATGIPSEIVEGIKSQFPDAHITAGTKSSRALYRLLKQYGFEKLPADIRHEAMGYYSAYADAMTLTKVTRHTVITVNPADFLLMSNANSWHSCHLVWHSNSSDGCYRAGCESYAYDEQTVMFYTVDASTSDAELTFAPKIFRQVYFWNGSTLIGSRAYPQGTSLTSPEACGARQLMESVIAECLGAPNLWRKVDQDNIRFVSRGYHYRDYEVFPYTAHELTSSTEPRNYTLHVGHSQTLCVCCGDYLDDEGFPVCTSCAGEGSRCESCDEYYDEDELEYVNGGGNWCPDCRSNNAFYCDSCNEYYSDDAYEYRWVHISNYHDEVYCENCFDYARRNGGIVKCEDDDEYWDAYYAQEWTDPETGEVKYYSPEFDLSELEEEEEAA